MRQQKPMVTGARRRGFTLVELTIVVLVLGILAAVATPKFMNTSNNAKINASKQSLLILRDSLELFRQNSPTGIYPAQATIATQLASYLNNGFPAPQIGANQVATVGAASSPISSAVGTSGYLYDQSSGEIRINDATYIGY